MVKVVDLQIQGNRCYMRLSGCGNEEFMKTIEYKSWIYKSDTGVERKYFSQVYLNRENMKALWCHVGHAPILIRYLQSLGYLINGKELFRSREIAVGNSLFQPYDFQLEAINSWMNCGCCGVIKAPTGSGKTLCACFVIQRMKVRTIICVHTNDLLINAWFNTLIQQFGEGIKSKIGIIGGKLTKKDRKNMRIISETNYESNISKDIVIATSQSLLNKLDKLSNERFGLLVVDETHHYPSEQFSKIVNSIRAPYRLGLSATLLRSDGMSPMLWGLLGDIVFRISIKELVRKGVLVEPVFNTIVIDDDSVQNSIATCGLKKYDLSRYVKQMSASSKIKMNYILKLVKSLCLNGKKFIMYSDFVSDTNNGVFTRDYYVRALNQMKVRVVGVSSDMSGGEREKVFDMLENNKIDGLVFGKLGSEGVNIPRVDSVILCNATKSTILFPQRVGRAMRTMKNDVSKRNAFVYEILLDIPMERRWSDFNFYEYLIEGYEKKMVRP